MLVPLESLDGRRAGLTSQQNVAGTVVSSGQSVVMSLRTAEASEVRN